MSPKDTGSSTDATRPTVARLLKADVRNLPDEIRRFAPILHWRAMLLVQGAILVCCLLLAVEAVLRSSEFRPVGNAFMASVPGALLQTCMSALFVIAGCFRASTPKAAWLLLSTLITGAQWLTLYIVAEIHGRF